MKNKHRKQEKFLIPLQNPEQNQAKLSFTQYSVAKINQKEAQ